MHSYLLHFAFVINAATLACGQSPDIKDLRPASSSPATLDDLQRGQVELKKVLREIEAKLPSSTSRNALISGAPRGIAFDAVKSPLEGRADAPITIVEISDYQCPFCRKYFTSVFPDLDRKYILPGLVRYVLLEVANERIHPLALPAAEGAACAGDQGGWWKMHAALMNLGSLNDYRNIFGATSSAGLNLEQFGECLNSCKHTEAVRKRSEQARSAGVTATPSFLIGCTDQPATFFVFTKIIQGSAPPGEFEEAIQLLQEEGSSLSCITGGAKDRE